MSGGGRGRHVAVAAGKSSAWGRQLSVKIDVRFANATGIIVWGSVDTSGDGTAEGRCTEIEAR